MEQCFRIAFWMMFLLTGYLQAQPVRELRSTDIDNLGFTLLRGLSCNGTMNFTSPDMGNLKKECRVAAMPLFMQGMKDAKEICTDTEEYIDGTIEALEDIYNSMKTTECNFDMEVHEVHEVHEVQFGQFVDKMKTFFEEWKSIQKE